MSESNNICRCCLSTNSETLNLFTNFHVISNLTLSEELKNCTNISENEELMSKFICLKCIEHLYAACAFRRQCINSDFIWKLRINSRKEPTCDDPLSPTNEIDNKIKNELLEITQTQKSIENEMKTGIIEIEFVEEQEEPEVFQCNSCDYITTVYKDLTNHSKTHKAKVKSCCTICKKNTFNIINHMKNQHSSEDESTIKAINNSNINSYLCNICARTFSQISSLKKHLRRHDNEMKASKHFSCDNCDKTFSNNTHLKRHEKMHKIRKKDEKIFLCNFCGKNFSAARYLENHITTHNEEKKYSCKICYKTFNREDSLASHSRTHTGEKPYECNICFRKFAQRNTLGTHMFLHTGKTVKCPLCEKMFSRPSMLIVHTREHTGEKPYSCDKCDRKFSQKCHLTAHTNTHLNIKQFQCEICQKEFRQKTTLKQHMYIHIGKPHKCYKCEATFIKRDRFRAHLKTQHGEHDGSELDKADIQSNIEISTIFENIMEDDKKQELY